MGFFISEEFKLKIVLFGKAERGVQCLKALLDNGYDVPLVVAPLRNQGYTTNPLVEFSDSFGIEVITPENPNDAKTEQLLKFQNADIFVTAGYGKILKNNIIAIPKIMAINLHGGKLPQYRGSSPMNWALINGEKTFTLTIIQLDSGVDTGDIISERAFNIGADDNIRELHTIANREFPIMLVKVIESIKDGSLVLVAQDSSKSSYYPLRFPDDGLIIWDVFTAQQIHNRIRALTEPYPCAFTYYSDRKVKILSSEMKQQDYFGEPGRVYLKSKTGLLVCAQDKCLWIREAIFEDNGKSIFKYVNRYDKFATVKEAAANILHRRNNPE